MPQVKVDVRDKLGQQIPIEIQCEHNGPVYTFVSGQIADIHNPREFARVCQIAGVTILDRDVGMPEAPPIPTR